MAFDAARLADALARLDPAWASASCCVALSGGVDSAVLLHALQSLAAGGRGAALRAVHVDHGLQPQSPAWAAHCRAFCARLAVPFELLHATLPAAAGASVEALAREARYAALAANLRPGEWLLTAHHRDDQLETVLIQLLRGAGVAGLAAMAPVSSFAQGRIARPLLDCPRAQLLAWARSRSLQWIDDSSNDDTALGRNYLRHRVLPLLRERWPGAAVAVARSARHAGEAQSLLERLARRDAERVADGSALSAQQLRRLDPERRRNLLRHWIARQGAVVPDTRRLQEIAGPMLEARHDANPEVRWGDVVVRREQGRLRIGPGLAAGAVRPASLLWNPRRRRNLDLGAEWGRLEIVPDPNGALDLAKLPARLSIAWRRGNQSAALKRVLQELHVPASEREVVPLIHDASGGDGRLLAVADLWLHPALRARAGARRRAQLRWQVPRTLRLV